jgi:pentatricopeptide repeat protein
MILSTQECYCFLKVLQAWTKSGHEEAAKRIHALLIVLKQKRIKKSTITYKILLRYFARLGDCTRLAVIWKEMLQLQDFVIDLSHRSQMVYGYSKMGNIDQAENFLYQMMECRNPKDVQDSILLVESIHVLLKAYRKTLENDVSGEAQRMIHHRLIRLKENVQRQHLLNKSIQSKCIIQSTTRDIDTYVYICATIHSSHHTRYPIENCKPRLRCFRGTRQHGRSSTFSYFEKLWE